MKKSGRIQPIIACNGSIELLIEPAIISGLRRCEALTSQHQPQIMSEIELKMIPRERNCSSMFEADRYQNQQLKDIIETRLESVWLRINVCKILFQIF